MMVTAVGGSNKRNHFQDDPFEEFLYQLGGDMVLKVLAAGELYDVVLREGDVLFLPKRAPHSAQRPITGKPNVS